MRKLIANEFMSLDWVVQAPGGADRPLRLVDGQVASTGAILATYAPAA
jgi:hypothetical protein